MKFNKILLTALLSIGILTGCTIGKGIITVNDEAITKAEYDKIYNQTMQSPQMAFLGDAAKDPESIFSLMTRDKIVNELIVKKILAQEIKKQEITVSGDEVKAKKEALIAQLGGEKEFKERLKQAGVTDSEITNDIKEEIKIDKLVALNGDITVSDNEVKDFYNKNKEKFNNPERVRASHILIEANPVAIKQEIVDSDKDAKLTPSQIDAKVKAKMDEIKAQAEKIRNQAVQNPKAFAELAKKYSADPGSKNQGGDLGFFAKGQMVKPFEAVAFTIQPNKISEVILTQYGYHIIMVTDRAKAGMSPLADVSGDIKAYLAQTKKVQILQNLFDNLKSSAKVVYVDESFSPDVIKAKLQEKIKAQQEAQK